MKSSTKAVSASTLWRQANPEKAKEASRKYYQANREKCLALTNAWRAANPEKVAASRLAWQKANPDKMKASMAAWRAANPKKVREYSAAWRAANPEKIAEIQAKRQEWMKTTAEGKKFYKGQLKKAKARRQTVDGFLSTSFSSIKSRASAKKLGLKITKNYLKTLYNESNMKCAISGLALTLETDAMHKVSFDRIDNNKGYVYGNIQVISQWVNTMKLNYTTEELLEVVAAIHKKNNL